MGRPNTRETLEAAHRRATRTLGQLSLAIETSRITGRILKAATEELRSAADLLDQLLPASRGAGEERR